LKDIKQLGIPIIILIIADQLIKILIHNYFFDMNFTIINHVLQFHPTINRNLSWLGNYIEILSNPIVTILLNVAVIIIYISGYNYYRSKTSSVGKYANFILITGLSGSICSFVDKVFWGGSLDYIHIPNFFIFDLKDCYINISLLFFCYFAIKYNKEIKLMDYLRFCFRCK